MGESFGTSELVVRTADGAERRVAFWHRSDPGVLIAAGSYLADEFAEGDLDVTADNIEGVIETVDLTLAGGPGELLGMFDEPFADADNVAVLREMKPALAACADALATPGTTVILRLRLAD